MPGCTSTVTTNCIALLPIADQADNGTNPPDLRVVTYQPFLITEVNSNTHNAQLLPGALITGQSAGGVINYANPGNFVAAIVPDS
jgi:hypothetical protein